MNSLTKEQIALFSTIACAIMLVAFLFLPGISAGFGFSFTLFRLMTSGAPFLALILLLLAFLAPIYAILYIYKDKPALASLKPIFALSDKVVYALPAILIAIFFIYMIAEGAFSALGFGSWLYLIAAGCLCFLGMQQPKK